MAYRDEVIADTPVGYWRLDTSAAYNEVTSANNTLVGTPTVAAGRLGNAWTVAENVAIDLGGTYSDFTSDNTWSVEAWFKKANNASPDYPTIWRRDGNGKAVLLRMHSNDISNPGVIEFYLAGSSLLSPARYDDGNWHHVVIAVGGTGTNAVKMYVDGSQVAQMNGIAVGSMSSGAGSQAIGAGGPSSLSNGEAWSGSLDEVAIYPNALTSTRVTAHYNASVVAGGYTAQAMTATADFVGGDVPHVSVSPAATPMTASGSMPGGVGTGNTFAFPVTFDGQDGYDSFTTILFGQNSGSKYGYFKTGAISITNGEGLASAKFRVTITSAVGPLTNFSLYTLDSVGNKNYVADVNVSAAAVGSYDIDISPVVQAWLSGTPNYGFAISNAGGTGGNITVKSMEAATGKPQIIMTTAPAASVSYSAQPMTASAAMPNAGVDATRSASVAAQAMTATATTIAPVVVAERFVSVSTTAEPMYAFAEVPGGGFAVPLNVVAGVSTASALMTDATVTTTRGVAFSASTMTASAAWVQADSVNGNPIITAEGEDAYFQRINALTPRTWLRLNDKGATARNRVTNEAYGIYNSVQVGQFNAPENRHSVHFTGYGSFIDSNEGGIVGDEITPSGPHALEFSFRTERSNAFLMVGQDSVSNVSGPTSSSGPVELVLKNGKITLRNYRLGLPDPLDTEFSGFRNLADGNWHTVVVRTTDTGSLNAGAGVEIWVDGTFEVRRYGKSGFVGFPDYIGGRPTDIEYGSYMQALPGNEWFIGDMSEISFFALSALSKEIIPRNYYAFMGWKPIEVEPMVATAALGESATGKGNQKRMLALYFSDEYDSYGRGGGNGKTNFDPLLAFTDGVTEYEGYRVFGKSVTTTGGQAYRDPVTDEKVLMDLEKDVNILDYDVITFQDWPDEGAEIDAVNAEFPGGLERLLKQLRGANDKGVGLFIVQPRLAVDLGIIDRVEFVPTLIEQKFTSSQGNAQGLYDYGSAVKFPWNITANSGLVGSEVLGGQGVGDPMITDPAYLRGKAYYYGDTNKNDRFRVRALVDGLTTIPSYMIQDMVFHSDYDQWGWADAAFKYLHRMDGLRLGDEYIYHGTDMGQYRWWSDLFDYVASRQEGTFATPPGHVKAGTVVTTFGATHWLGDQEVENPYKDYATTIVLQPGDSLGGRAVGGKIFVNFTEQPNLQPNGVVVQVTPQGDEPWPQNYKPETAAQRQWEWSFTRKTLRSTSGQLNASTYTTNDPATGELINIKITNHDKDQLIAIRSSNIFPIIGFPTYQMIRRGLLWLKDAPERAADGSVTIRPEAITATASMGDTKVVAQRDAHVYAEAFTALAQMPKVAEDTDGSVEIHTLPMLAYATFTGFGRTIQAEPMTANAEFVENFDAVHTSGEQVVLTLHGYDVTLYLKEEA